MAAEYLIRNPYSYCFRMVVPPLIRGYVGLSEVRYSLKTTKINVAKPLAIKMAKCIKRLFNSLSTQNKDGMKENKYDKQKIKTLTRAYLRDVLEEDEQARLQGHSPPSNTTYYKDPTTGLIDADPLYHDEARVTYRNELATHQYDFASRMLDLWLSEKGIELDKASIEYKRFCHEMARIQLKALDVLELRDQGRFDEAEEKEAEYTATPTHHAQAPTPQPPSIVDNSPTPVLLKKVIASYTREQLRAKRWTEKSKQENHACYNLFLGFAGEEVTTSAITYPLIREYKEALQKLPPSMNKSPLYRDKTIHEIVEMDVEKTLGVDTINKYLNRISTLFKYAVKNGYMDRNPAEGMQLPKVKRDDELRAAYTHEDLQALFHSTQYVEGTFKQPFQFWTPLIALFTGMRQTEIAQLHLEDIRQEDEVWVFDINDNGPDKKVKTKNAKRLIPIHPFLCSELNLVGYASSLREEGHTRLFPEIPYGRDGFGQKVSRWFNGNGSNHAGYRKKCGIIPKEGEAKKDFHSFRHTFIDHLKQKQVHSGMLHELDGHSAGTMTMDRYGKRYSASLLLDEIINKVEFHEIIPLDHLAKSKWCK